MLMEGVVIQTTSVLPSDFEMCCVVFKHKRKNKSFTQNDNCKITLGLPGFASVGKMAENNALPPTPAIYTPPNILGRFLGPLV